MRKMLLIALALMLAATAMAVTTDRAFDYAAIVGHAQSHYGEVYTIVGKVIQVDEMHRSSDDTRVEEYARIAVDDDAERIVCLHYMRPTNQYPLAPDTWVAALAYVDGVERTGTVIIPLMESKIDPMVLND